MKKAASGCRINGLEATKITLEMGETRQLNLTVEMALLSINKDGVPVLHAKMRMDRGWPRKVAEAVETLRDAIESHLLQVHFNNEGMKEGSNDADKPFDITTGLGGSGLVRSEDEPEQL